MKYIGTPSANRMIGLGVLKVKFVNRAGRSFGPTAPRRSVIAAEQRASN
ncbi:MAG: hypothetical protein ACYC26_09215 [Phycisphaerales bacterium]